MKIPLVCCPERRVLLSHRSACMHRVLIIRSVLITRQISYEAAPQQSADGGFSSIHSPGAVDSHKRALSAIRHPPPVPPHIGCCPEIQGRFKPQRLSDSACKGFHFAVFGHAYAPAAETEGGTGGGKRGRASWRFAAETAASCRDRLRWEIGLKWAAVTRPRGEEF